MFGLGYVCMPVVESACCVIHTQVVGFSCAKTPFGNTGYISTRLWSELYAYSDLPSGLQTGRTEHECLRIHTAK